MSESNGLRIADRKHIGGGCDVHECHLGMVLLGELEPELDGLERGG